MGNMSEKIKRIGGSFRSRNKNKIILGIRITDEEFKINRESLKDKNVVEIQKTLFNQKLREKK